MDEERWQEIEQIVDTALTKDKSQRKEYIHKACKGDKDLIKSVTQLLENIEKSGETNYLEDPNVHQEFRSDLAESVDQPTGKSLVGKQIDQYEINDLIGHGGMGSVYLAERTSGTYHQTVALKVMRRGMDTPANIARFKREQHILAKLNHPNIARLIDGGITDENLPYLVMEYVDGIPLYEYCNTHQLSINDRLELFQSVCHAVQHAHSNTVIHRDLKPSNILITKDGTVKVLDFGIAKLLEPENPETTFFETRTGARMLTFVYAAPEQIEGETVTTATDSYTLGVVLYELLAGVHPFDLEDKNLTQIEQVIRNKVPTSPNNKFRQLPEKKQRNIATERNTNPSVLADTLKGDLDAIVMKALRKEPDARYDTVEQFLKDLRRCKNDQPIVARKDTFRYKTSKFFKRHKAGLSVAAGFLILIASFAGFYTWQITQERNRAQLEAEKAEEVTDFLVDILGTSNPYRSQDSVGLDITLGSILQQGSRRIDQELNDQPAVEAELKTVMGQVYFELGELGKADSLLTQSMAIHRNNTSGTPGDKAETLRMLAFLNQDEGNYKKAENLLQEAIETFKQTRDGPVNDDVAISLTRLGNLKWFNQGNFKAADSLLNKALVLEQEIHSDNHLHIANVNNDLAAMTHGRGLLTEAKPYYQAAIAEYRNLAGNHANLAIILSNYSALLLDMGDYTEAKNIQQEALQMHRKQTGEESIDVALGIGRLGKIALNQGNYQKADSLLNLSLNKTKNIYGKSHPYIARLHLDLGRLAMHRQKYQSAGNLMQQAHSEYQKVYPKKHPRQSDPLLRLGLLHSNLDNLDEAKSYFTKSLDIRKASYPIESWHVAEAQAFYGNYLLRTEEYEKAEKMLAKSYDNALRIRGKDDAFVKEIRRNLGKTDMTEKYKQP